MSGHGGSSSGQDFDVNITPIIDCFTVLITFMLASASFLSIGILDAGVPGVASDSKEAPPPYELTVKLRKDGSLDVKLGGKASKNTHVAMKDGKADYEGMAREVASVKKSYPVISAATLSAEDEVEYKAVVESMDRLRKEIPDVLLGE